MVLLLLENISCDNLDFIPKGSIVEVQDRQAALEMIEAGLAVESYDPRTAGYEAQLAIEQSQDDYLDLQCQISGLRRLV